METRPLNALDQTPPTPGRTYYSNVLLDVDGVLLDFHRHALRWHGRADLIDNYPRGQWSIAKTLGMTEADFWSKIDDETFWKSEPAYTGSDKFLAELRHRLRSAEIDLAFCTSSSRNAAAFMEARIRALRNLTRAAGITDDLPTYVVVHGGKGIFGRPGNLLVDDYVENIRAFTESCGEAIMVPMVWNTIPGTEPSGCRISHSAPDYAWLLKEIFDTVGV